MAALVRTNLLIELLFQVAVDLAVTIGWHGAMVVTLITVLARGLRRNPMPQNLVCVTSVLLVLMLIADRQ
ncbi:hypothetical protein DVA86_24980 [Streptomyces armeniacus]|uniref:Uncharacterized protein n=1 Tax=Streptomyces armeniacus TaxID=83291 RepID=A0A345XUV3_9ACTN|nr:hypothetical protein [Streptomyces armeniacus]AXK35419.1 hypothetical protein DVA86_24980 [Streptomyces armeniacus]